MSAHPKARNASTLGWTNVEWTNLDPCHAWIEVGQEVHLMFDANNITFDANSFFSLVDSPRCIYIDQMRYGKKRKEVIIEGKKHPHKICKWPKSDASDINTLESRCEVAWQCTRKNGLNPWHNGALHINIDFIIIIYSNISISFIGWRSTSIWKHLATL